MHEITAFAPVSIGNLCVGFDILGAAIAAEDGTELGDRVTVTAGGGSGPSLTVGGKYRAQMPVNAVDNLVIRSADAFFESAERLGKHFDRGLKFHVEKGVPVGSGLGSSAASIVATLTAMNHFFGKPFAPNPLLRLAGVMEGSVSGDIHLDNVAPIMRGGVQLLTGDEENPSRHLPFFEEWRFALVYPGTSVETRAARAVLPDTIPVSVAVAFARNLSSFIHGLHCGNAGLAAASCRDVVAEPYRRDLVPGFDRARTAALSAGALVCGLSGSGPTTFALAPNRKTAEIAASAMAEVFPDNPLKFTAICRLDEVGARVVHEEA